MSNGKASGPWIASHQWARPSVTVACVIEHDGRFLMVEEDRGTGQTLFNQPAGHVESGEGPLEALHREVEEETAWTITVTGYLGLYVFHADDGRTFHTHGFTAVPKAPLATPLDADILAAHWLEMPHIQALDQQQRLRSPLVIKRIEDARAGIGFTLDVIHPTIRGPWTRST